MASLFGVLMLIGIVVFITRTVIKSNESRKRKDK